jgi:hypothetical protein
VRYFSFPDICLPIARVLQNLLAGVLFFLPLFPPGETSANPVETRLRAVDSFSEATNPGKEGVPAGWALEGKPGRRSKIFLWKEETGAYLALVSVSDSFGLKKEMVFDLGESPHLSWRWRVTRHPQGGDIRQKDKDDQAGQIYVIFGSFPLLLHYRALGYIWDPAAPVGYSGTSRTYSRMKYQVIRSGSGGLDQWIEESRDVRTDFRKLFQEEPPPVAGVMLFINTQFTGSSAECRYRNLFFRNSPKGVVHPGKNLE